MTKTEYHSPDIFLCHSKEDVTFVRKLARDLHELQIYAWFDEWELMLGGSLHDSIARALEQSAHIGVVVSPDSVESTWVRKELNQALAREGRSGENLIIPLKIRDATMPPFLEDKLYLDFGSQYETALTRLAAHVYDLDIQRIMERLTHCPPGTLADVQDVLRFAGWRDVIKIGSRDWEMLTKLLRRHSFCVLGNRLSLFDPVSKQKRDVG